jgi:dihydrofolate synthase/folylpolyglutamate synthase
MDFAEALAWLDGHINYERLSLKALLNDGPATPRHAEAKLKRVARFLDLMAEPHRQYPMIHVTGTDGKTSTVRLIAELLAVRGMSVGTYTSPNLERVNERLGWNGENISDEALAEVLAALAELEPLVGERFSYFEVLTVAAYRWFADIAVDAAVVEVGLGGRWDATNVGDGSVAVVTNVGTDHIDVIGPTRADIAREKSGIVKPGATLVLGETDPELRPLFEASGAAEIWLRGRDYDCTANRVAHGGRLLNIRTPGATYDDVFLQLHGGYQGVNAAGAVAAAEAFFDEPVPDNVVREALVRVRSPGRTEVVNRRPLCIVDGGHTPEAAAAVAASIDEEFGPVSGRVLVLGFNRGHDMVGVIAALGVENYRVVITCAVDWPRAVPAGEVADAVRAAGGTAEPVASVDAAVDAALAAAQPEDLVLVTGSLYTAGAARSAFSRR